MSNITQKLSKMALFKEGNKVLHVDSKEHGFIVTVKPPSRGAHQY